MGSRLPEDCAENFSYITVVMTAELEAWISMAARPPFSSLTVDVDAGNAVLGYKTYESLLWSVVTGCRPTRSKCRGEIVQGRLGVGSTVAYLICRQFGYEYDERK